MYHETFNPDIKISLDEGIESVLERWCSRKNGLTGLQDEVEDEDIYSLFPTVLFKSAMLELYVKKNVDIFDFFYKKTTDLPYEKDMKFYTMLKLMQKLNGSYQMACNYSNGDYENTIEKSNIFDNVFMSFHMDSYMLNVVKDMRAPVMANSLYGGNIEFHSSILAVNTAAYMRTFFRKFIMLVNSDYFDKEFLAFFNAYRELSGKDRWDFIYNINTTFDNRSSLESFLVKKLRKLGFMDDDDEDELQNLHPK